MQLFPEQNFFFRALNLPAENTGIGAIFAFWYVARGAVSIHTPPFRNHLVALLHYEEIRIVPIQRMLRGAYSPHLGAVVFSPDDYILLLEFPLLLAFFYVDHPHRNSLPVAYHLSTDASFVVVVGSVDRFALVSIPHSKQKFGSPPHGKIALLPLL